MAVKILMTTVQIKNKKRGKTNKLQGHFVKIHEQTKTEMWGGCNNP